MRSSYRKPSGRWAVQWMRSFPLRREMEPMSSTPPMQPGGLRWLLRQIPPPVVSCPRPPMATRTGKTVVAFPLEDFVQCVVVGWLANLGTNIAQVAAGLGSTEGYLGESYVGFLTIGDTSEVAPQPDIDLLFNDDMISGVPGFTLGLIQVYPPRAVLTAPTASGVFVAPTNIVLNAQAWQPVAGKYVQSVLSDAGDEYRRERLDRHRHEFAPRDEQFSGRLDQSPPVHSPSTGRGTDNAGACGTSAPVNITVAPVILVNGSPRTPHNFRSGHQHHSGHHGTTHSRVTSGIPRTAATRSVQFTGGDLQRTIPGHFIGPHQGGFNDPELNPLAPVDLVNITVVPLYTSCPRPLQVAGRSPFRPPTALTPTIRS